jgi:L-ascorbate metabolism protein UlaG (beta-lactamase superfamily)
MVSIKQLNVIIFLIIVFNSTFIISQQTSKITYLANEGFLIETANKKILIDALFGGFESDWCDLPTKEMINGLEYGLPPFNNIDVIAVTHNHRDHFSETIVVNFLLNNPSAILVCPVQVDSALSKNVNYKKLGNQIISVTPTQYNDSSIVVSDISIRILRLEHSHFMEEDSSTGNMANRHRNIENLGYLFNIEETKLFHCGDTNPLNEKEYSTFLLNEEKIDIALLERLFYSHGEKGVEIINKYINPMNIIVMHINPGNKDLFANHFKEKKNIHVIKNQMDTLIIN